MRTTHMPHQAECRASDAKAVAAHDQDVTDEYLWQALMHKGPRAGSTSGRWRAERSPPSTLMVTVLTLAARLTRLPEGNWGT